MAKGFRDFCRNVKPTAGETSADEIEVSHAHGHNGSISTESGVEYASVSGKCYTTAVSTPVYEYKNCAYATMDWIVQGGTCPFCGAANSYEEVKHDWICSVDGSYHGTSYTKKCSRCGSHDSGSGGTCYHNVQTGTTTKYACSCSHAGEIMGTLYMRKKASKMSIVSSDSPAYTVASYLWGGIASGTTSEVKVSGHGQVTCTVGITDPYSTDTVTETLETTI